MIKFLAGKDTKRQVIGLGLSEENVVRLRQGRPIHVDLLELGLPWQAEVLIFYGVTEQALREELAGLIGPETEVHNDPRLK